MNKAFVWIGWSNCEGYVSVWFLSGKCRVLLENTVTSSNHRVPLFLWQGPWWLVDGSHSVYLQFACAKKRDVFRFFSRRFSSLRQLMFKSVWDGMKWATGTGECWHVFCLCFVYQGGSRKADVVNETDTFRIWSKCVQVILYPFWRSDFGSRPPKKISKNWVGWIERADNISKKGNVNFDFTQTGPIGSRYRKHEVLISKPFDASSSEVSWVCCTKWSSPPKR